MRKTKSNEGVLALDLGTSSVRAVVYDTHGQMVAPTLCDLPYKVRTTYPGEVSSDPDELVRLIASSIDAALKAARKERVDIIGAAAACYWHSLMGVDRNERPTTELLTWADTRSASETRNLRTQFDERAYHSRTGCFFHASFWPAKLRWLQATRRPAVARTARWISLAEYLYHRLLGDYRVSLSIASGTGLFDIHRCQWDAPALDIAGIGAEHLSPLTDRDQPITSLRPTFAKRWPQLRDIPWFLPLGDGALANVGAGCVDPRWLCATIGTSSALRVTLDRNHLTVPWGAFVYRLDKKRFVLGGALSEGRQRDPLVHCRTRSQAQETTGAGGCRHRAGQPRPHRAPVLGRRAKSKLARRRPGGDRGTVARQPAGADGARIDGGDHVSARRRRRGHRARRSPPARGDRDRRPADSLSRLEADAGRRAQAAGDDVPANRGFESGRRAPCARGAGPAASTVVVSTGARSKPPAAGQPSRGLRARPPAPAAVVRPSPSPTRPARAHRT